MTKSRPWKRQDVKICGVASSSIIWYYLLPRRESIRIENIRIKFKFIEYIQIHIHSNWEFLFFNSFEFGFLAWIELNPSSNSNQIRNSMNSIEFIFIRIENFHFLIHSNWVFLAWIELNWLPTWRLAMF